MGLSLKQTTATTTTSNKGKTEEVEVFGAWTLYLEQSYNKKQKKNTVYVKIAGDIEGDSIHYTGKVSAHRLAGAIIADNDRTAKKKTNYGPLLEAIVMQREIETAFKAEGDIDSLDAALALFE